MQFKFWTPKNNKSVYIIAFDRKIKGFIYSSLCSCQTWQVLSVASECGYGHKLHEAMMDFIYPQWIIPSRSKQIKPKLFNTYKKFNERQDIINECVNFTSDYVEVCEEHDDWFNRKYRLDEKIGFKMKLGTMKEVKHNGFQFFLNKYEFTNERHLV